MIKSSNLPTNKTSTDFSNDTRFPYGTKNGSDYKNVAKTASKSAEKNFGGLGSGTKTPFNADFRIRTQGKRVSEVAQKMLAAHATSA
jgi:adenylylsulfate kinase-like enzyme